MFQVDQPWTHTIDNYINQIKNYTLYYVYIP